MSATNVVISLKDNQLVPSVDPVSLSKSQGNTILWHNETLEQITLDFPSGTPFPARSNPYTIPAGGQAPSGNIQVDAGTSWKYNISSASGLFTDPQIIVQP